MYNSVREMHIAIDYGLQHISSNRKQSINNFLKDLALNYSVLQFIELRSSGKTNDGKGFEDTQKRYDDLKELKRVKRDIPTIKQNDINEVFVVQPDDYYKLIGSTSLVLYNKFKEEYLYDAVEIPYKTLVFPNDYGELRTYKDFKIVISEAGEDDITLIDIDNYKSFPPTVGHDSKFMYVNLLLNKAKNIHWQRWDDIELYDTFIIIDDNPNRTYTLTYKSERPGETPDEEYTQTSNNHTISASIFSSDQEASYSRKRNELLSTLYSENIDENVQYSRNRHRKPISKLIQNRLVVEQGSDFLVPFVDIEYIKKPTLIDHITGKTCELSVTREIIDLAVQRLKAYIKDEGYQHIVNETQFSE